MKNRYTAVFLGLCLIGFLDSSAQAPVPVKQFIPDKPFLFAQLPDRSDCIADELLQLFRTEPSDSVIIHLSGSFQLQGVITEKIQRSADLSSINIKLSNYPGALFTISLSAEAGQSKKLIGRIIHPNSGDVLLLMNEDKQYYLKKQLQKFFMTE